MNFKGGWIAEPFPPVSLQNGEPWVEDVGNESDEMQLGPLPNYNSEDPNAENYLPPQIVRDQLASGYEFERNDSLSIELNVSNDQTVDSNQLRNWTTENAWTGRFPAIFFAKNSIVSNNCLVQVVNIADSSDRETIRQECSNDEDAQKWIEDGKDVYDTTFFRSEQQMMYGYVEIACKLGDSSLSSAFWLKEHGGLEREIDVFEFSTSKKDSGYSAPFSNMYNMNIHKFTNDGDLSAQRSINMCTNLSQQELIKIGFLWTTTHLHWYINDVEIRKVQHNGEFCDLGMNIQLDREYLSWFGLPNDEQGGTDTFGDFVVHYVRTWNM